MKDLSTLKEKYPVVFAQFQGETVKDMALHNGELIVITDKSTYTVDETGRKTEIDQMNRVGGRES